MPGHGRRDRALGLIFLVPFLVNWIMVPSTNLCAQTIDWRMPAKWKQDAELTDLFFIDRQTGWIVGDRGLVLRTDDGGKTWQSVKLVSDFHDPDALPIHCRLETVVFASATHGWIAGGYSNPRSTTSIGVLFSTADGGRSWKRIQGTVLPRIKQLEFASPLDGIAVGDGNAQKPSGVFQTRDGGKSWSTVTEGAIESWQIASRHGNVITLANENGKLARYTNQQLTPALIGDAEPAVIREMKMLDERFGFAVGDRGSFLQTRNGGLSWHPVQENAGLPAGLVDYQTMAIHGNRMWIAGDPGSWVYTRKIGEPAWQRFATPTREPLSCIRFVDDSFGWAVGCCGDVIHTEDGGRTWSLQRRGTRGVALLQIAERADEFIPELFSRYCSDEDYIGGALLLETDTTQLEGVSLDALRQALSRVGGSFTRQRQFANNSDPRITSTRIQEYLVRQIRLLRPRVIAIPSGRVMSEPLSVRTLILNAVRQAADPDQYRSHIDEFGMQTWQVGKVVVLDRGDVASLKVSNAHYMMDFGALLGDHVMPSRMLLNQPPIENRPLSLTTVFTSPYAAGSNTSLFGAIENTDAAVPVRQGRRQTSGNMAQMRQLASKQKTMDRLLEWSANLTNPGAWSSSLSELTMQLDDATAGIWLFNLANQCEISGNAELAAETHLYLTNQYRKHPLSVASFRWLYNYYSSSEQAWLSVQQTEIDLASSIDTYVPEGGIQSRPVKRMVNGVEIISWEVEDPQAENQPANFDELTTEQRKQIYRRRFQQARSTAQSFSLVDPTALDVDRYWLARIGLNQKIDPLLSVEPQLKRLIAQNQSAVGDAALTELGIISRRDPREPVRDEVICHSGEPRPWLDGKLDDDLWKDATGNQSIIPMMPVETTQTGLDQVLISADQEFLYLAVRCRQSPDVPYEPRHANRKRDADLTSDDRVEIAIDIDRDYQTYFLFSVDSSGKVADSFGNNLAWNPTWYVATRLEESYWVAEIAIPLSEISQQGDFWAICASRHIRNRMVASSRRPRSLDRSDAEPALTGFNSLHRVVSLRQASLHALPLQAFRLIRMPWAGDGPTSATTKLPSDE